MKLLRLAPYDTNIPFFQQHPYSFALSALLMLASVVLYGVNGLNFGIDFRGGTLIEIRTAEPVADLADLRSKLTGLGLGEIEVQGFGGPNDVLIRVVEQAGGEEAQQAVVAQVRQVLGEGVDYRRVEIVGPKVSGELVQSGIAAVLVTLFAILVYIWFRFDWQFGIAAVVGLFHDVVLTIGIFALLQIEFNLSIIAATLAIVGYSLNDTVVVSDRVRENLRRYKRMPMPELINLSLNQTLARSILTSASTLVVLFALYFLGGEALTGFVFALIWGVIVGTYSTIYVAAPLIYYLQVKRDWSQAGDGKDAARQAP